MQADPDQEEYNERFNRIVNGNMSENKSTNWTMIVIVVIVILIAAGGMLLLLQVQKN